MIKQKVAFLEERLPLSNSKNKVVKATRFALLALLITLAMPGSCVGLATCGSILATNGDEASDKPKEHQATAEKANLSKELQFSRQKYGSILNP